MGKERKLVPAPTCAGAEAEDPLCSATSSQVAPSPEIPRHPVERQDVAARGRIPEQILDSAQKRGAAEDLGERLSGAPVTHRGLPRRSANQSGALGGDFRCRLRIIDQAILIEEREIRERIGDLLWHDRCGGRVRRQERGPSAPALDDMDVSGRPRE